MNKMEGSRVIPNVEGKEVPYVVLKQGVGYFEKDPEYPKKSMGIPDGVGLQRVVSKIRAQKREKPRHS